MSSAQPAAPIAIVDYGPIEGASGWILTRERLFLTHDEGATWQDVSPALQGSQFLTADFAADGAGWLVAVQREQGALLLGATPDLGATWHWSPLSLSSVDDPDPAIAGLQLDFADAQAGVLQVRHTSSSNFYRRSEWRTADGGATWARVARHEGPGGQAVPVSSDAVFLRNGEDGWRLERSGQCRLSGSNRVCEQAAVLFITHDGGQTWRTVRLPEGVNSVLQTMVSEPSGAQAAATATASQTMIASGHGFDKCEVPTLDELREWRSASPYSSVNLYIGGASRACDNAALDASYVRKISSMGWGLIPTWVGPQAPCTSFRNRISSDVATAESQGRADAHAAADTLAQLGLTAEDETGSIVYYDIEYYNTTDGACNAAVQSFITGWNQALRGRGHLAGVYGAGSTLSLLVNLAPPPDAIWAANWIYDAYEPIATVWNVYRLSNDVWSNHQRLRQYTGGHDETWGSLTLRIDSSVLDGPVAVAGAPLETPTPTPTATATVIPTLTRPPTLTQTRVPMTPTAWFYLPLVVQE